MTIKRLSTISTSASRRFHDRLTYGVVSVGGALVLMTLLVMFFYLLYAVLPLFRSPSITPDAVVPWSATSQAPADVRIMGIDPALAAGFFIDAQGQGWTQTRNGGGTPGVKLMPEAAALSAAGGGQPLYLLSDNRGDGRLAGLQFAAGGDALPAWVFPFGESLFPLSEDGRPVRYQTLAQPAADRAIAAAQTASGRIVIVRLGPAGVLQRAGFMPEDGAINDLQLSPDGRLLYLLAGNQLSIYQLSDDGQAQLRQRQALADKGAAHITLLPAGGSLLVLDASRRLSLWFDVADERGHHLERILEFAGSVPEGAQILPSARRPMFGVLSPRGDFSLYGVRQPAPLMQSRLAGALRAAFSPLSIEAGDGGGVTDGREESIITLDGHGWRLWRLDTAFAAISWRTLTQKIHYQGYPAPAWVWQSTSADGLDSGKYSLVPLLAGTLKAAGYAMVFAAPLALAAAMYTAWFMSPTLRRWVKPAMEIVGAVPSVVIGLIAGLWLAPYFSRALSGILLLPLLLPLVVLALGWVLSRLPALRRARFAAGWECLLLMPVVALVVWLACRLSPWLDGALLGESMSSWLGDDYNPLNALVVGAAMGFALVPAMFSLAEDALFNVPARLIHGSLALGATPWQTLVGVTLPSASAGLFSAFILGFGRAIGETMIVLMASGNLPRVDGSLFQGLRALAANIAIELPEAAQNGAHYRILLLTAMALFVFAFLINTLAEALRLRLRARYQHHDGGLG